MKWLSMIASRLWQYMRHHTLTFCLYVVCSLFCGLGFIYMYGNFTWWMGSRNITYQIPRTYTVHKSAESSYTMKDVHDRLMHAGLPSYTAVYGFTTDINGPETLVFAPVVGEPEMDKLMGRTAFTDEELQQGAPVVVVGMYVTGSTVQIGETNFRIIGRHKSDECYIPPNALPKTGIPADRIRIMVSKMPSPAEDRQIQTILATAFEGDRITSFPAYLFAGAVNDLPSDMLLIAVVYALLLASFMFLMKYMMDVTSRENVIYTIAGASKGSVIRLLLRDNLCLSVPTAVLSLLLFTLLKKPLFDPFSLYGGLTYELSDYLLVFFSMVLVSTLTCLPFIWGYGKRSAMEAKHAYE